MTTASRSTTVKFGADTSGLKKGTDEMIQQLNKYNKALVDNQYRQKDIADALIISHYDAGLITELKKQ